jgi:hypothetical protein
MAADGQAVDRDDGDLVVVPTRPGPLIRPRGPARRSRDDLDELVDELFPDTAEGPGRTDAVLLAAGCVLVAWGLLTGVPALLVVGGISAVLGLILPLRAAWRRAAGRLDQRRQTALSRRGTPLWVGDPVLQRLVASYDQVVVAAGDLPADLAGSVVATAHGAVADVATLLAGRTYLSALSDQERSYATTRAMALRDLEVALAEHRQPSRRAPDPPSGTVVEARDEVDQLAGTSSVTRLTEIAAEVRARDDLRA